MGGDEFIILGERTEIEEIEGLVELISAATRTYNKQNQIDFFILPSMGYSVYRKGDTIDSFLATADQEMYRTKQKRKETLS
jgi:GGDEF domain-containing protein